MIWVKAALALAEVTEKLEAVEATLALELGAGGGITVQMVG